MPTVFTHSAVPLAMGLALGRKTAPRKLICAGVAASILPDMDILTFYLGVPLSHEFGHRGFSHSILFAAIAALIGSYFLKKFRISSTTSFIFLFLSILSHGCLDAITNGGHGIAFFWPWSTARYFMPYRFIQVSPIYWKRIFTSRLPAALISELFWVWMPLISSGLLIAALRKHSRKNWLHPSPHQEKPLALEQNAPENVLYPLRPMAASKPINGHQ